MVCEDIVDHGNLGGIFRCAAALGMDAVILAPRCADPLYRRAVKVSMGAVFAVPYARLADWRGGLSVLRQAGFRLLALTPDQSATPIGAADPGDGPRCCSAPRGTGCRPAGWPRPTRLSASHGARRDGAGVDSLNVVAAAAIACCLLAGRPERAG